VWAYDDHVNGCKCAVGETRAAYAYGWQQMYSYPWYFNPTTEGNCTHVLRYTDVWRSEFTKQFNTVADEYWKLMDACSEHSVHSGNHPCNMFKFVSCVNGDTDCDPIVLLQCANGEIDPTGVDGPTSTECCTNKIIMPIPPLEVSADTPIATDEIGYAWHACFTTPEEAIISQPSFGLKFAKYQLWWKLWEDSNPEYSWRDLYNTIFPDDSVLENLLQYLYSETKYPFCCRTWDTCTGGITTCPDICTNGSRTYLVYTFEHDEVEIVEYEDEPPTVYHFIKFDGNGECILKMEVFDDNTDELLNTISTVIVKPPVSSGSCPAIPCEEWTNEKLIARAMELYQDKWESKGVLVEKDGDKYTDYIVLDGSDPRASGSDFDDDCSITVDDVKCDKCGDGQTMVLLNLGQLENQIEGEDPRCGFRYWCIGGDITESHYPDCYATLYATDQIYDADGEYCGRLEIEAVAKPFFPAEGYRDIPPGDEVTVLDIWWTPKDGSPTKLDSVSISVPNFDCMNGATMGYCEPCIGLRIQGTLSKNCSGRGCDFNICLEEFIKTHMSILPWQWTVFVMTIVEWLLENQLILIILQTIT